jgi:hypothetical protein
MVFAVIDKSARFRVWTIMPLMGTTLAASDTITRAALRSYVEQKDF